MLHIHQQFCDSGVDSVVEALVEPSRVRYVQFTGDRHHADAVSAGDANVRNLRTGEVVDAYFVWWTIDQQHDRQLSFGSRPMPPTTDLAASSGENQQLLSGSPA